MTNLSSADALTYLDAGLSLVVACVLFYVSVAAPRYGLLKGFAFLVGLSYLYRFVSQGLYIAFSVHPYDSASAVVGDEISLALMAFGIAIKALILISFIRALRSRRG